MKMFSRISICSAILAFAFITGCEEKKAEITTPSAEATAPVDIEAKLAKADAFDGKTDKVVAKCSACQLHMEGSPDQVVELKGYKLHFCSESCKKSYEKEPEKSFAAMKMP